MKVGGGWRKGRDREGRGALEGRRPDTGPHVAPPPGAPSRRQLLPEVSHMGQTITCRTQAASDALQHCLLVHTPRAAPGYESGLPSGRGDRRNPQSGTRKVREGNSRVFKMHAPNRPIADLSIAPWTGLLFALVPEVISRSACTLHCPGERERCMKTITGPIHRL